MINILNRVRSVFKFLLMVFSLVGSFVIVASLVVFAYKKTIPEPPKQVFTNINTGKEEKITTDSKKEEQQQMFDLPDKTNFLIIGLDNIAENTDTILVGSMDSKTQKIDIISIPRDTYIILTEKTKKRINEFYKAKDFAKINSVYLFTGAKNDSIYYLQDEIKNILNINIDYYAIVNTKAFREIVDTLGGLEYNLIRDYDYDDPLQDLHIHLKKGFQKLDGDQVEQLMRFRNYAMGDLDRITVQQDVMKEFFKQVLSTDKIKQNALGYAQVVFKHVKTDFGINDLPSYVSLIFNLNPSNISFHTLPGHADDSTGPSYFIVDKTKTAKLVNDVFYKSAEQIEEQKNTELLEIEILNGSNVDGLASKKRDLLLLNGYNNVSVSTYKGDKKATTRINVKEFATAEPLVKYFSDANIQTDDTLEPNQVKIIVGTDETDN